MPLRRVELESVEKPKLRRVELGQVEKPKLRRVELPLIAPEDPEATPEYRAQFEKPIHPIFKAMGKVAEPVEKYGKKGFWAGLGAVAWPFERISGAIGTPLSEINKKRAEYIARGEDMPYMGELPALKKSAKITGKSLISRKMPEEATPLGDWAGKEVYADIYESLVGKKPSGLSQVLVGMGAEFVVVPYVFGKMLKAPIEFTKQFPSITKLIKEKALWRRILLRSRARTGGRIEQAKEIGRSVNKAEATKIADEISQVTGKKIGYKAVQERLTQIVSGGVTTQPSLAEKANPIIKEFKNNAKLLRKYGILGEETYLTKLPKKRIAQLLTQKGNLQTQLGKLQTRKFPGRADKMRKIQGQIDDITTKVQQSYEFGGREYFPRMYATKEAEAVARRKFPFAKKRIRAPYAKRRGAIPFEARRAMGEIKEIPYPVTKRMIQESADIETAKLFGQTKRVGLASEIAKPSWKKLPDTKAYGVLKNNFVPSRVYDDITGMVELRSAGGQLFDFLIGNWKAAKTVWNPSLHFRNNMSNAILLDLSGTHYSRQLRLSKRAIKEIQANSKDFQFAKNMIMRTTMSQGEILEGFLATTKAMEGKGGVMQKMLNAASKFTRKIHRTPSKAYAYEEFWGKFIKFLEQRELGKSPMAAFEVANKTLFDYTDLAAWEIKYARRVMPFYTFPRKAIPRVLEAAAERPYTFAKYPLLASTMTKHSLAKLDIKEKDWAQIQKTLPEYMQRGNYILMPYRDENDDLRFFDWTYIIPWGPISELQERGMLDVVVTNPVVQIVADIKRNKDSFTDRKIWDDTIPESQWTDKYRKEQTYKKLEHVWRVLAPSLAWKGIYWDKLHDAATGIPKEKPRLLPETIAHTVFGLRTQAIDVKEQKKWQVYGKMKSREQLRKELRTNIRRKKQGRISEEEFNGRRQMILEQMKKLGQR